MAENSALAVDAYQRHLLLQVMAPLTAGSIGILYAGALLIYTRIFSLKPSKPISSIAMFAGILILVGAGGLSILNGPDAQHVRDCASLQTLYDAQQYKIAEGVVHITGVLPSCTRSAGDSLKIGSTWLDVCYYVSTCEYKLSNEQQKILTEGTYARVYIYAAKILRIDIENP